MVAVSQLQPWAGRGPKERSAAHLGVQVDGGGVLQPLRLLDDRLGHLGVAVPHADRHYARKGLRAGTAQCSCWVRGGATAGRREQEPPSDPSTAGSLTSR